MKGSPKESSHAIFISLGGARRASLHTHAHARGGCGAARKKQEKEGGGETARSAGARCTRTSNA